MTRAGDVSAPVLRGLAQTDLITETHRRRLFAWPLWVTMPTARRQVVLPAPFGQPARVLLPAPDFR